MMLIKRASAAALVAATFAFGASAVTMPANAGPAANATNMHTADSEVIKVQDRRYYNGDGGRRHYRHRGHYDGWGWNPGAAIGLGIAGAVLEGALNDDEGYDEGPAYGGGAYSDAGARRCAAQFRSFEPETGLYTTYGGEKRMCPYLG